MKTSILAVWVVALTVFSSCDELLDQAAVKADSGEYKTELSIAPSAMGDHLYVQKLVEADLQQMLAEHGNTNVTVKRINITSAVIEIAPDSKIKNFNAIDVLNAIVETDILPSDTIATYTNTLVDAKTLNLDPLSVDVADYMQAKEYSLAIDGTLKQALTDTLKVNFKVTYEIIIGFKEASTY